MNLKELFYCGTYRSVDRGIENFYIPSSFSSILHKCIHVAEELVEVLQQHFSSFFQVSLNSLSHLLWISNWSPESVSMNLAISIITKIAVILNVRSTDLAALQ